MMKKTLLILLCIPMIGFGQKTYVPDNNFEQALIDFGYDNVLDDSVFTSNIAGVKYLNVSNLNISELTGIEDFILLDTLNCSFNLVSSLDVSNNIELKWLACSYNQLTSIDLSNNINLKQFGAEENLLNSIDVSNNINLITLICHSNQLNNADVRNGNNLNSNWYTFSDNPQLFCINVDDPVYSNATWTVNTGMIDSTMSFSTNCSNVFSCADSLEVTDVIIDNTNLTMDIAIYNGFNSFINYPFVAFTIDANGDTIQGGNISLFGAFGLDTTWYNYSILSNTNPTYPLSMYFVYQNSAGAFVADTCILTYNAPTVINNNSFEITNQIIYPNPSTNILNIDGLSSETEYKIYNLIGSLIMSGKTNKAIDISDLIGGNYIIKILGNKQPIMKFIKQ